MLEIGMAWPVLTDTVGVEFVCEGDKLVIVGLVELVVLVPVPVLEAPK